MKRNLVCSFFCCLLLLAAGAGNGLAAQNGKSGKNNAKPIICTITNYYECNAETGCVARSAKELDAPRFFKIWIKDKKIELLGSPGKKYRISRIDDEVMINGIVVLQGIESKGKHGAIGWTISINSQTGGLTFSASGDEVGYIGIGACTVDQ